MTDPPLYEPVLSSKAVAFLVTRPKRKQLLLIDLLDRLALDPFRVGDYQQSDETGRQVQFLLIGDYIIGYWADHAVKELRIVEIEEV